MENTIFEKAKKVLQRLNRLHSLDETEVNLKDNKIYFPYKEKNYRVRMPNFKERKRLHQVQKDAYARLVGNTLCAEVLTEELKKSGKDINKLDIEKRIYEKEIETKMKLLAPEEDVEARKILITDIEELKIKIIMLSTKKAEWLGASLESQIKESTSEESVYLLLEKENKDGEYKRFFEKKEQMDDFQDLSLLDIASYLIDELGMINNA